MQKIKLIKQGQICTRDRGSQSPISLPFRHQIMQKNGRTKHGASLPIEQNTPVILTTCLHPALHPCSLDSGSWCHGGPHHSTSLTKCCPTSLKCNWGRRHSRKELCTGHSKTERSLPRFAAKPLEPAVRLRTPVPWSFMKKHAS